MKKHLLTIPLLLAFLLLTAIPPSLLGPVEATPPKVAIQEDGSIWGTSNILREGDTYTLTDDITGALYVLKDNIVINGAGHTLTGENGRGIVLKDRQNVTLKNTRVTNEGAYIIELANASNCKLIGNTLLGVPGSMLRPYAVNLLYARRITIKDNSISNFFVGLSLDVSSGHTIAGNTFTDGVLGIVIDATSGCTFRNNKMVNCSFSVKAFGSPDCENDLDASNTINGKPIYYWVNKKDQAVPSDAAYVALVKCTNILVSNSNLDGITLVLTADSIISNVKMVGRGDNIHLLDCSYIQILNSILHNRGVGIRIMNSSNCQVSGNEIANQITRGIDLSNADNTLISHNTFTDNAHAIASSWRSPSKRTTIETNNFTRNVCAVAADEQMKIIDNIFEANERAIIFSETSGTIVTQNNFTNNKNVLYFSNSSGNIIYQNNFLYNERQVIDGGVQTTSYIPVKSNPTEPSLQLLTTHAKSINYFPPPPPSTNQYDKDGKGNYWIDYTGYDKNGDGIGDPPYTVYENNQDNYPLMKPTSVNGAQYPPGEFPSPTLTSTVTPNSSQASNENTENEQAPLKKELLIALIIAVIVCAGLLVYRSFKTTLYKHT